MIDPYIGEVSLFPYEFEPEGWARCDGRLLPIEKQMVLFSLIGNRFGGDGRVTFALPKMPPPPTSEGATLGYFISIGGIYPRRP